VDIAAIRGLLNRAADAVKTALGELTDWGLAGTRPGQYKSDLVADKVACEILLNGGLGILSEESGAHNPDADIVVVLDPLDGSTNASRGLPWYAISLCAMDSSGPLVSLVVNLATGRRYEAVRDQGAFRDGRAIEASHCAKVDEAIVGFSGYPDHYMGWSQFRALGAAALDLCAVAEGAMDAYVVAQRTSLSIWDYMGGLLICREAGAHVADANGRGLITRDLAVRRRPIAAASAELLSHLLASCSA
jgi:fructose-1,6-bisphosphatase/inositol monophosphatase family enzyme